MTICNWRLRPDRATIINDSLATDGEADAPAFIAPKVLVCAHLLGMIGSKGAMKPASDLWVATMTGKLPLDLAGVVAAAPGLLQASYAEARPFLSEDECTVFVFAWCPRAGRVRGWAFAWENGFAGHELAYTEAMMPGATPDLPGSADWGATILRQQSVDRALAPADRDNIGGFLTAHHIIAHPQRGAQILIENLGPLPHFAEDVASLPPPSWTPSQRTMGFAEWERCASWLAAALARDDGRRSMADLRAGYAAGRYTLFPGKRSAALVEIITSDGVPHLHFYLAGGKLEEIRDELRPRLEEFGRRHGCSTVFITGRRGWERAFSDYRRVSVIDRARNWWLLGKELRTPGKTPAEDPEPVLW